MKDKQHTENGKREPEGAEAKPGNSLSQKLSGQVFISVFSPARQVKKPTVENDHSAVEGHSEYMKEKLARIQGWYDEGRVQGARYLLFCVDTFDWRDGEDGLYQKYAASLRDAVAFERRQLTGIDMLVGFVGLDKPLQAQIDAKGEPINCLFYPATGTCNVIDPVRAVRRQTQYIADNLDYIESEVDNTGASPERIGLVLENCRDLRNELAVFSRVAQAMDDWECRFVDQNETFLSENIVVLHFDFSAAIYASEKIAREMHDLAVSLKGEGELLGGSGKLSRMDLLCVLVMESAANVANACKDIKHAFGVFEMLQNDCAAEAARE